MGLANSGNETWKSTAVAEINKFKNHFDGTTEYVAAEGSVAYVERGTNGVVISNLGDNNSISITAHRIAPGTYVDQITQNEFIVANGQITGTVDDNTGVAVLYDPNVAAADCISASKLYLKPNKNWISANARFAAHFYNLVGGTAWVDMTEVEDDEGIYELTVPEGEWTGVIFCRMDPSNTTNDWENGSVWNQTANLFPDSGTDLYTIADGAWSNGDGVWSIYGNSYNEAAGFYLIGNITDWSIDPAFKMSAVDTAETEEYVIEDVNLATSSQLKIIYSPDGYSKPDANYYPQGMGNNYGENGEIEEDGVYKIYFRPNYDGSDDWFYGCIYAEKTEDLSDDAGYYLIGSMTEWSVDPTMKLTKDSDDPVEYIITVDLVTTNQFKIVYSPDGTLDGAFWYPDGMGNNYGENGEIPEDGTYTVRFRPNGDGDDDWFYNCINVQSAPSTVPPRFDGKSLVLSGQLGMNFYLVMDEQYADGTMTFKVGNRDAVTATGEEQPDGRYKFTCYVTSVEMADAIVATYTYMDGEEEKSITLTESKTVNVENYLLTLIAAKPSDASLVKLCNAILYYGYHAQQYLSAYNHWTIGEDHAEMVTVHSEAYDLTEVMTALSGVTFKKPDIEGVTTTYKLRLDSETTVDVYFKLADADMTFSASATFGTETYTAEKQKDGRYRIRIPSISAHRLGEWIPITGTAGEETFETKVAVMAYVNDMLTGNYYPESNQLMAALFYYYAAVDEYEPID